MKVHRYIGPHFFIPHETPPGDAPETLRNQWVGIPLPVKYNAVYEDTPGSHIAYIRSGEPISDTPVDVVYIGAEAAINGLRAFGRYYAAGAWHALVMHRYQSNGTLTADTVRMRPLAFPVMPDDRIISLLEVRQEFAELGEAAFGEAYTAAQSR